MSRRPLHHTLRVRSLLALAVASAIGALVVWLAAFAVPSGQRLDAAALEAFAVAAAPPLRPSITGVAGLAGPASLAIGALALVVVALLRRRWLMAAVVPVILLGANVVTQLLKPGLAHPRIVELSGIEGPYPASWPSGHSTVAMSLALCAVLVVGPRLRPLAALAGAGYAVAVGYSLIAMGWHLPSDVIGGFLIASTFTLLGAAALSVLEARQPVTAPRASRVDARAPDTTDRPLMLGAFVAAATAVLCALAVLARHPGASAYATEHPSALLAAAGVAVLGLALTAALTLALRR
ncbi:MAG: phosphatase PAP2 family protein [Actinomycetota bacterium]|nr:phosphatase PAP2 family protein [Actinomycetota bacterium]